MQESINQALTALSAQPAAAAALGGIFCLLLFFIYMRRIHFTTQLIVQIAFTLAITILLHQFWLFHMPQGGGVTCGAMVPLLLLSFRHGVPVGAFAGFLYGFINLIQDPFLLHPVQVLFDYPLPYMAMGLAAVFPNHRFLSIGLAFLTRFFCHFISGFVFFASYAPEGTPAILYSFMFNISYLLPECLICLLLIKALPVDRLLAAMRKG